MLQNSYKIIFLLLFLFPSLSYSQPRVIVGNSGPTINIGLGASSSSYASLSAAVTDFNSTVGTLIINTPSFSLGGNVTVPSTMTLEFANGGTITCSTNTGTIQSSTTNWPSRQIFDSGCKDKISFSGAGSVTTLAEWWGAVGDGVTDDTIAVQAAINATCTATRGGIVELANSYLVNTSTAVTGFGNTILYIPCDNLTLDGKYSGILRTTNASSARLIMPWGAAKPAGIVNAISYEWADATVYSLTGPIARGSQCVTTSIASDAGNFALGDDLFIRTGQVINGTGREPDAESATVTSANAGTGEICFYPPTSAPYVQECYVSGSDPTTITSSDCSGGKIAAPFGIANITDRTLHNVGIINFKNIESTVTGSTSTVSGGQIVGFYLANNTGNSIGPWQSMGSYRNGFIEKNIIHINRSDSTFYYCYTTATGTSHVFMRDNICTRHGFLHIHEGSKSIFVSGMMIQQDTCVSCTDNAVSVRARGYTIILDSLNIFHNANSTAVRIEAEVSDGSISNSTIGGGTTTAGITVLSTNGKWAASGNRCLPSVTSGTALTGCGVIIPASTNSTSNQALAFSETISGSNWTGIDRNTQGRLAIQVAGSNSMAFGGTGSFLTSTGCHAWTNGNLSSATTTAQICVGSGSPEGVKTAAIGSIWLRIDGGAGTTFYVKESGTGNTGWVAK